MSQQSKTKESFFSRLWPLLFVFIFGLLAFFFFPLKNWFIEAPGSAEAVGPMVTINGKKEEQKGDLYLTTVLIQQATPYLYCKAKLTPFVQLLPKEEVFGDAKNSQAYDQMQTYYMETSQNIAKKVALSLAKKPYHLVYEGIYVMDIASDSSFQGKLQVGDFITEINGQHFKNTEAMLAYIRKQKVGSKITLSVQKGKKEKEVTGQVKKLKETKQAGIGITLVSKTKVASKENISIQAGDIGGPSAGLMFTLQLYELLSGKDLQRGRKIAGTGEIYPDGRVGRIGGIQDKVVAADKVGATIFFAPDDTLTKEMKKVDPRLQTNYQEAVQAAKKIHTKMKIVPVKRVQDAIHYLET